MLQSNSVSNMYNSGISIVSHISSQNKVWVLQIKNSKLVLAGRGWKSFDSFNISSTGFRLGTKRTLGQLLKFLLNLYIIQWCHLAFRGKSYRIRNFCNANKFTFNLGYSHWTKLKLTQKWAFFKRRRQKYVVFTYLLKDFNFFKRFIPHVRFYNCYTMRGLRLRKQPIIRRFGKISQHISILH